MKLLSLIAMGLACAMAGRYIAYRLSRRVRILEKISLMFGIAENEIKFLNRPTSELIELLEKKDELAELDFLPKSIHSERAWAEVMPTGRLQADAIM